MSYSIHVHLQAAEILLNGPAGQWPTHCSDLSQILDCAVETALASPQELVRASDLSRRLEVHAATPLGFLGGSAVAMW